MRPAGSTDEYLRDGTGRYVNGRNWISYCQDERLSGVVLWGRPDDEDIRQLLCTTPLEGTSSLVAARARLIDVRQLDVPPASVFTQLHGYFSAYREVAPAAVTGLALVRPSGMVGALVAGFAQLLGVDFPMASFTDPVEALLWLGVSEHACVVDELDRIQGEIAGTAVVVRDLRRALEAGCLASATLATIAREMGLSTRSLQRRLMEAGTSFQREIAAARVGAAQRMLTETPASVTEVAYEVGYSSVQQFGAAFRKLTGTSPKQWRSDRRRSGS